MKKKLLIVLLVVLVLALSLFLVACNDGSNDDNDNGTTGGNGDNIDNGGDEVDTPPEDKPIENLEEKLDFEFANWNADSYRVSVKKDEEGESVQLRGQLVIPSEHEGLPVVEIDSFAFEKTDITSVVIPNTIVDMRYDAFSDCKYLTKVTFEEGSTIETLGNSTFWDCISLTTINIPESVKEIGECAFWGCESLKEITLPDGLETISYRAFDDCALINVVVPNTVIEIDDHAFDGCDSLESITLSNNLTRIGEFSFACCFELKSITLPESLTEIGDFAFSYCEFTSITIPASVTTMGKAVFSGVDEHSNLKTVNCEVASKPEGWDKCWNSVSYNFEGEGSSYKNLEDVGCQIVWGN